jgi:hypothetical protein
MRERREPVDRHQPVVGVERRRVASGAAGTREDLLAAAVTSFGRFGFGGGCSE